MTVTELINKLSSFDTELEVVLEDNQMYQCKIDRVYLEGDKVVISMPYIDVP